MFNICIWLIVAEVIVLLLLIITELRHSGHVSFEHIGALQVWAGALWLALLVTGVMMANTLRIYDPGTWFAFVMLTLSGLSAFGCYKLTKKYGNLSSRKR